MRVLWAVLLLLASPSALASDRFDTVATSAERIDALEPFLNRYVGHCTDVYTRATCEANVAAARRALSGKTFTVRVTDAATLVRAQLQGDGFVLLVTPFVDGGGLALTGADFINIPYLAFKSDYTNVSAQCQTSVDAVKAAGGKADYIQLDQPGWWQGSYAGPFGNDYVGPFAGVSHMHMIEDNPAPQRRGEAARFSRARSRDRACASPAR